MTTKLTPAERAAIEADCGAINTCPLTMALQRHCRRLLAENAYLADWVAQMEAHWQACGPWVPDEDLTEEGRRIKQAFVTMLASDTRYPLLAQRDQLKQRLAALEEALRFATTALRSTLPVLTQANVWCLADMMNELDKAEALLPATTPPADGTDMAELFAAPETKEGE